MAFWSWSRTAASNATADTSINYAEGQSPSSVNDSCRAVMARLAEFRDDTAGAITSGGTSTAYTISSYQGFDTRPHMGGQIIAFTPHTTNGATVTLNVDGLGALPLRSAPSTEIGAGVLVQGTPYVALYNNTTTEFLLQGLYSNPYNVPLGVLLDYTGTTAPNSNFVLAYGQAISRTTYSAYFAMVSTTYGVGDGINTFNVIDLRGRTCAGLDNMGGSAASRVTFANSGITGTAIGSAGGAETVTLATANLPAYTPTGTVSTPNINTYFRSRNDTLGAGSVTFATDLAAATGGQTTGSSSLASAPIFTGAAQGGISTPVNKMAPTAIVTKLLRIF